MHSSRPDSSKVHRAQKRDESAYSRAPDVTNFERNARRRFAADFSQKSAQYPPLSPLARFRHACLLTEKEKEGGGRERREDELFDASNSRYNGWLIWLTLLLA